MSATGTLMQTVTFRDLRLDATVAHRSCCCAPKLTSAATRRSSQGIIDDVQRDGDLSLIRYGRELDHVAPHSFDLKVSAAEFAAAEAAIEPDLSAAIHFAADNIRRFHATQRPAPISWMEVHPGAFAGDRITPIDSVACYVPRARAPFRASC